MLLPLLMLLLLTDLPLALLRSTIESFLGLRVLSLLAREALRACDKARLARLLLRRHSQLAFLSARLALPASDLRSCFSVFLSARLALPASDLRS